MNYGREEDNLEARNKKKSVIRPALSKAESSYYVRNVKVDTLKKSVRKAALCFSNIHILILYNTGVINIYIIVLMNISTTRIIIPLG